MASNDWYNAVANPTLYIKNLDISYKINRRWHHAVRDFQLEVEAGQIIGIVGESGSGKSTVLRAIVRYLGKKGRISGGQVYLNGDELTTKTRRQMRFIWNSRIHMVPQNPFVAMNPSIRVGEQLAEVIRIHSGKRNVRQQVFQALEQVRLADPQAISQRYPHELSGGMQQRVMLAMAFSTSPQLLLLDEPTTALDVTTEATILDLIRDLVLTTQAGAIYVTHNLGVVAQLCERVTVMYAGEIMENASVADLYQNPLHPYTIGLLACVPRFGQSKREAALRTIPGRPPAIHKIPSGCVFAERCPVAIDHCFKERPTLETTPDGQQIRCHRWREIADGKLVVKQAYETGLPAIDNLETETLVKIEDLSKHFEVPRGLSEFVQRRPAQSVKAVDGVNLSIQKGRTLGLVGESGSGKTTLARVIMGLTDRTQGKIELLGVDIPNTVHQRHPKTLRQLQMVFQNPQASLNPYLSVGQAIRRPLIKLGKLKPHQAEYEMRRLLKAVNLDESYIHRYPSELSGGEKQRVAIARAFASQPELIVCDEPVSALDVSVQAAVLNLLARLQEANDTSYLFISHDLAVVSYLADYLAVMYLGELFEVGYGSDLSVPPYHPYTEALVSAIPVPDPNHQNDVIRLNQDIPSPRNLPSGCRFHTRCPRFIGDICRQEIPPWRDDGDGHWIKCHHTIADLAVLQTQEK